MFVAGRVIIFPIPDDIVGAGSGQCVMNKYFDIISGKICPQFLVDPGIYEIGVAQVLQD